jgi:DUF2934 family protein
MGGPSFGYLKPAAAGSRGPTLLASGLGGNSQEKYMAETRERRKSPRKPTPIAAKPEAKAGAPRKPTAEERSTASETNARDSNVSAERSPEEMRRLIEEAAYYRAKQRGFEPGHELEDWIQAESEVMRRIDRQAR